MLERGVAVLAGVLFRVRSARIGESVTYCLEMISSLAVSTGAGGQSTLAERVSALMFEVGTNQQE